MAQDLTEKQRRFVEEYLVDFNATQAAIRAGYSEKTAYSQGQRLLKHVEVSADIKEAIDERRKAAQMDALDVLQEFSRLARSDILNYVSFDEHGVALKDSSLLTEDQARCISEVSETVNAQGIRSVKFKLYDKNRALENLAKHLGLFVDRVEVTTKTHEQALAELDPKK